jgi:hypothetical protein
LSGHDERSRRVEYMGMISIVKEPEEERPRIG